MAENSEKINQIRQEMKRNKASCLFITDLADIAWLTGFTGTTAYAAITQSSAIFITDGRYATYAKNMLNDYWELVIVKSYRDFFTKFSKHNKKITIQNTARADLYFQLSQNSTIDIDTADTLLRMRMIKTEKEIHDLKDEYSLAARAFLKSLECWQYGQTEQQWAATLEYNMKMLGARSPSFETIIASGKRGALPHGTASQKIIQNNEAVTIDFGSKRLYNSDYTRVIYSGTDENILNIINIVQEALELSIKNIKPNVKCSYIDKKAREYIDNKGYGKYFIHGLGHGVGCEVHEMPNINSKSDIIIEKGMVFTIEPGIYIPDKYGIRLEQTVAVNENGCELLSNMLDKYVYKL